MELTRGQCRVPLNFERLEIHVESDVPDRAALAHQEDDKLRARGLQVHPELRFGRALIQRHACRARGDAETGRRQLRAVGQHNGDARRRLGGMCCDHTCDASRLSPQRGVGERRPTGRKNCRRAGVRLRTCAQKRG